MDPYVATINAFVEDTCVLIVIAYLLARGRLLTLLSEQLTRRKALYLGFILGLIGMTEIIFPGARFPYVTHTLIVTFATLLGGVRVGLVAVTVVTLGAAIFQARAGVAATALVLCASVIISASVRRLLPHRNDLMRALIAGASTQAGAVTLGQSVIVLLLHGPHLSARALSSIVANGFGVLLLQFVINEARIRADSERNRLEVERSRTLVAEAQLVALRARIHPHFLFNTLTSIAALCGLAPAQAETATIRLSQLMRRALEANPSAPVCLTDELEFVRGYLEIEQHRLGKRLQSVWSVDANSVDVRVPAFSLQTLVENAILHGIAPKVGSGTIQIIARRRRSYTLIAVLDNGVGMTRQECAVALAPHGGQEHGLQIVTGQLRLLYGTRGRLRLYSRLGVGTISAFAVPNHPIKRGEC